MVNEAKEKAPKGAEDVRLTIRLSDALDEKLRQEAIDRGTNVNQTMVYILNKLIDSV